MVIDMAWGSSNNCLLVLLEPATFVMINADNGVILRTQTIAQGMVLTSIEVDSWHPSTVALTTMSQTLFILNIHELPPSRGASPQTDVSRHEISNPGKCPITLSVRPDVPVVHMKSGTFVCVVGWCVQKLKVFPEFELGLWL
jgi:hypothetical protein